MQKIKELCLRNNKKKSAWNLAILLVAPSSNKIKAKLTLKIHNQAKYQAKYTRKKSTKFRHGSDRSFLS